MKEAEFYEVYGAIVDCPYCDTGIELDIGPSRYIQGEEVTCPECKEVFLLGESVG